MSQASALRQGSGPVPRAPARASGVARLRVVPAAIERTGTGKFATICMVVLAVGLLTLLMLNTQLAQGAFTLHDLQVSSGTLTDQEHELTRALDAERNPAALAKRAIELGMVPATSMAFIRLEDGVILGTAEPAADKPLVIVTSPRAHANPPPAVVVSPAPVTAVASDPEVPDTAVVAPGVAPTAPAAAAVPAPAPAAPQPTAR